jgi:predicted nucleotidyltransferase
MRTYTDPESIGLRVKTPEEVRAILLELRVRLDALYGERLRGLYLFGSYARDDAGPGSDLDVLVVLDRIDGYMGEVRRMGGVTSALSLAYDTSIVPVFVREVAWRHEDSPFLENVRREGRAA